MTKTVQCALFALGAIAGGGAALALRTTAPAEEPPADRRLFRAERRVKARAILRDDLRNRLAELEERLRQARRRTAAARQPALDAARKPFDGDALLRYQREADPAAYARQTNAIVRNAILRTKSQAEDVDLLASVDASRWAPAERAAFEEYVELSDYIARYEANLAELRALDPELPASYGYDAIGEEICRKFELQCDVRYRLMAEAAKQYGLSEETAMSLADVCHRVVESTLSYRALRDERERNEARRRKSAQDAADAGGAR